jgi:glucose-1-phosphate cytidylyltransferase
MKVVILCGGLGTRLREETEFRPKPMLQVGRYPIVWHIMKTYAHYGFNEFVLCLGYRGNMIREYFLNYEAMNNDCTICLGKNSRIEYHGTHGEQDFRVTLADTGPDTMTGGRLRRVARFLDGDEFLLTYGDGVSDVDIRKVVAFHRSHGKKATLTAVHPISRFGVLDVTSDSSITDFAEKPVADGWINAGFMVLNRSMLELLTGDDCVLEHQPLRRLAQAGELMAYRHEGFFFAMDTYRDYNAINELWASGKAPWKVWND